jgi:hypothetical protein
LCSLKANGDLWRDLAFTLNPANQVRILFGSASGSFTLGPVFSVGSSPLRVGAGDMDADGDDDLIVAGQRGGIFLGNGAASFVAKPELGEGDSPPWVDASVVDFDGDGFKDVVGLASSGAVFFARGNGRAEFGQLHWFASIGSVGENSTFALADFTGDGLKDFARPTNTSIYFVSVVPHLESADLPIAYCEPKASSNGCVPQIAWEGMPSASATSGFVIRASPALNQKPGLIIYSLFGPASQTLGGGTLCVSSPLRRSAATNSGGTALPAVDCSGVFTLDFAAFAHGTLGGTPAPELLVPGDDGVRAVVRARPRVRAAEQFDAQQCAAVDGVPLAVPYEGRGSAPTRGSSSECADRGRGVAAVGIPGAAEARPGGRSPEWRRG